MDRAIVVENLVRRYGALAAVDGISFAVPPGTIFGLLGRNGAGKTTTLECCIGIGKPSSGTIRVLGLDPTRPRDLAALRPRIGVQLQATSLPEKAAVREVLELYAAYYGIPSRAAEMAARVGLDDKLDRQIAQMSGGEQQRLALARALARDPAVLFLDEPTASLDPAATKAIEDMIRAIAARGIKVVMSTHDLGEARRLAGEIVLMHRGRIFEQGPAEAFFTAPQTAEAATFIAGELLV